METLSTDPDLLECQLEHVERALTAAERTLLGHLMVIGEENLGSKDRGRYDILMSRLESAMLRGRVQYLRNRFGGSGDSHLQEDLDLG